jgi:hypothetical protein
MGKIIDGVDMVHYVGTNNQGKHVYVDDNGEKFIEEVRYRRENEVVATYNPQNRRRNYKHSRFRTGVRQKRVIQALSADEKSFLFSIIPYTAWGTNAIVGDGNIGKKDIPMNWTQMERVAGITSPTRRKVIKSLLEKGLLGYIVVQGEKRALCINPILIVNGRAPDESLLNTFNGHNDLGDDE